MKKRFYMLLFVTLLAGSVSFALNKSATTNESTVKEVENSVDGWMDWLSGLWGRAGDYTKKEDKIIELRKQKQDAADKAKADNLESHDLDDDWTAVGDKPVSKSDDKPAVKSESSTGDDGQEESESAQLNLRGEIMATLLRAGLMNKQGQMDDATHGYLKAMLEGLMHNNLDAGEDNLIASVNTNTHNTIKAYQEGALDEDAMKKYVEDTYTWWYKEYNVADQHQAGGLSPDPVDETLFDDWDDDDDDWEEEDWDDDEEDDFPSAPKTPKEKPKVAPKPNHLLKHRK